MQAIQSRITMSENEHKNHNGQLSQMFKNREIIINNTCFIEPKHI